MTTACTEHVAARRPSSGLARTFFWLSVALLALAGAPRPAQAAGATFVCTPSDVTVYKQRIHVRCTAAAKDGPASIVFWAVPTSDAHWANRFLTLTSTALVSGRALVLSYNTGDTSGSAFGCGPQDCRAAWAVTLR